MAPHPLFSLIRRSTGLWARIFLLSPLVSVYPQELLYRAFFLHRYQPLFGRGWGMLLASAMAFAFVHIIFRNSLGVALCMIGGFFLTRTYPGSRSPLLASLRLPVLGCV